MSGLTSAYSAGMRARSKVYRGTVTVRMVMFNPDEGGLVDVGKVRSFELGEPQLSSGGFQMNLNIGQDSIATAEKLTDCQFSIDGNLYKVLHRADPISSTKRVWRFVIQSQGTTNDNY